MELQVIFIFFWRLFYISILTLNVYSFCKKHVIFTKKNKHTIVKRKEGKGRDMDEECLFIVAV